MIDVELIVYVVCFVEIVRLDIVLVEMMLGLIFNFECIDIDDMLLGIYVIVVGVCFDYVNYSGLFGFGMCLVFEFVLFVCLDSKLEWWWCWFNDIVEYLMVFE